MNMVSAMKKCIKKTFKKYRKTVESQYLKRFKKHAFVTGECVNEQQYEAYITKLYHSIEKGLAYENYRKGFGEKNIEDLLSAMEKYSDKYDVSRFFYKTALSTLWAYVKKNEEHGLENQELKNRLSNLKGEANDVGGVIEFTPVDFSSKDFDFEDFLKSRHSIRDFSEESVNVSVLQQAIRMAQYTPSACNRQCWRTRIICNKNLISDVLANQNGNRGFGEKINSLLVVTADLRYFSKNREHFQAFIDGGMYAMNLLHCLHHQGVATVPLSASLTESQDKAVRKLLKLDDAEILILFIGVGQYPERCITTRSERKPANIEIIE